MRREAALVLLEPYCSPLSTLVYRYFHHEELDLDADAFADDPALVASPLDANIARPTLAFFRHAEILASRWPRLRVAERRLLSLFVYPLTGGFSRRSLIPLALFLPLAGLERLLAPLARLLAFRCLVVLEATDETRRS